MKPGVEYGQHCITKLLVESSPLLALCGPVSFTAFSLNKYLLWNLSTFSFVMHQNLTCNIDSEGKQYIGGSLTLAMLPA